jgi:hypothetical protein
MQKESLLEMMRTEIKKVELSKRFHENIHSHEVDIESSNEAAKRP